MSTVKLIETWAELRRSGWRPEPRPPEPGYWLWAIPIVIGIGIILALIYS